MPVAGSLSHFSESYLDQSYQDSSQISFRWCDVKESCLCVPFANGRQWHADAIFQRFVRFDHTASDQIKHDTLRHSPALRDLLWLKHWLKGGQAVDDINQFT